MGRGLVEPTDDVRSTNPATHPTLLKELARQFRDHNYSWRYVVRTIASSQAYARSAQALPANRADDRFLFPCTGTSTGSGGVVRCV